MASYGNIAEPLNAPYAGAKSVQKIALTDLAVKRFPIPEKTTYYWDKNTPGLGLRIGAGGARTFLVLLGSGQRHTIGRYPSVTLHEARGEARRKLGELALGRYRPESVAFDDAKALFLAACQSRNRPRTIADYRYHLNRHFKFGRRQLASISPQEISRVIDKLAATPSEQNHAYVTLRVFMRWAVRRHYLSHSPLDGMLLPSKRPARERVLADDELKAVFTTAANTSYPFGPIISLLVLTGQRRGEIAALRWEWIEETITLPASITKNKRQHSFPYGQAVKDVLASLPFKEEYLFPASRDHVRGKPTTIFNGWQKAKVEFDKRLGIAPWTLHDLRRTFSSNMAALGVAPHITEKLLNHVSGTVSGVAAVYNRYAYVPEMRAAITLWEQKLESLVR